MKPDIIRRSLAVWPRFTQRFWTWLTGLLPPNEASRHHWTQWQHFLCTFGVFWVAAALSLASMQHLIGPVGPSIF